LIAMPGNPDSNAARREEIRLAVRTYLAERPAVAPRIDAIQRGIYSDTGATLVEVTAAVLFLKGLGQAEEKFLSGLGSTVGYRITSAGILAHERGE
jgi:hypothetical protein